MREIIIVMMKEVYSFGQWRFYMNNGALNRAVK